MKTFTLLSSLFCAAVSFADVCTCGVATERNDDFYWENDKVAFRAYGPRDVHRWSGFDVFNKGSAANEAAMILHGAAEDKYGAWHNLATVKGGLRTFDNYTMGASRGVGGLAFWGDGEWKTFPNWESCEVLHTGDDYLAFRLVYPAFSSAGRMTCRIILKRGERFFRNDVSFEKDFVDDFAAGPGMDLEPKRDHKGALLEEPGLVALYEDEKKDSNGNGEGSTMSAIFIADPSAVEVRTDLQNCRVLLFKKSRFTYWAGTSWSGMGEITSAKAWFDAVRAFRESVCREETSAKSPEATLAAQLPSIFARSVVHYRALDAAASPLAVGTEEIVQDNEKSNLLFPTGYNRAKKCLDMRSIYWWTAGHFPGTLWYLYEATGDAALKERALFWTERLAPNATADTNHDLGFIMNCSFGNARRLLKTSKYDDLLVQTAKTLSRRFSSELGVIRSWGNVDEKKNFLVIPDCMMNLELLEVASKISGDPKYDKIARSHATITQKNHFRSDGGTYHVLNYDQRPGFVGSVQEIWRGQGLSCTTAWSRGQSWAIYGYTMMYRETKDWHYRDFAIKVADYAVSHPNMPTDGIPYWDFGAPGEERDSSAGSIMAAGLLELAEIVGGEKGAAYRAFAVKQLLSLASPAYFSEGDEIGHFLLKHGVGHKPAGGEVDSPLTYGDYYFVEALLRFKNSLKDN